MLPNFTIFSLCFAPAPITKHHDLICCQKGAECYTRQKCHRWVVLDVRPIGGIFSRGRNRPLITRNNLLLEGVRLGLSQKKTPRDSTQTYSPRGLTFWDGPRMTPYHNKSGRRVLVRSNACSSCHFSISAKLPERSTSGTFQPLNSDGRV